MNIFGIFSDSVQINGKTYKGKNVSIVNGEVFVDGKIQSEFTTQKNIRIQISGNVHTVESQSGDVEISGGVSGDVSSASGDIKCGAVGGSVQTASGDVKCGDVRGNVKTLSGDISRR